MRKNILPSSSVYNNLPDDIEPTDFAKNVLLNCGYLKSRRESAKMLRKGSGYLRLLDRSPSYGFYAGETYYGKLISIDDGSMHTLNTTNVGVVNIEDRNRLKLRRNS